MIRYFSADTRFNLKHKRVYNSWIKSIISSEDRRAGEISLIFCSDDYLLDINKKFINHDYYTDIITFDYCEEDIISGDLFISIDSVRANSETFGVSFQNELNRVIAHGILHLLKYDDHCDEDMKVMRSKENYYIARLENE